MEARGKATIIFQPSGRRGEVEKGKTILDASRQLGVDIETLCGGRRICGKCKVKIEQGSFEKYGIDSRRENGGAWQEEEEKFITSAQREEGYRLGCCARVEGDLLVFVPEESRAGKQVVSKAARDIPIEWDPAVKHYYVEVPKPTLERPTGDLERLLEELKTGYGLRDLTIDYRCLISLPDRLREEEGRVSAAVWMDEEIIRILPGERKDLYGIAIDVGTTTMAAYLCNLVTMEVVETVSMMNPQCKYGEDVMSRISYHMANEDGLQRMNADIIEGVNSLVAHACENTHPPEEKDEHKDYDDYPCLTPTDIIDMTIVGNTAMHHILLRLNPGYMGTAPFPPVAHKSMDIKGRDMGIVINESAYVYVLPNEAGFVGADNVGVLIAEEPYKKEEMQLIIDIGTNGELVLGNKEKLISSSCATGPAFEGAQITFGMRAAPGAIERISIDSDTHEVDYKVIGKDAWRRYSKPEEMQAKGICGSGIFDVLAELYRAGVIGKSGRFNLQQKSKRYRQNRETNQSEFVIAWAEETSIGTDIVITQKDIRQIQLGKGAVYSGCKLMMRRMGIDKADVVKIAGAFGTHVNPEKALIMGLFPDCKVERIVSVGNAAGDGARAALLNRRKRKEADWVSRNVHYLELTVEKDFEQQFVEALEIPHKTDSFPHLRGIVPDEILNQK
jgi:uncharacterized 2Fe-2S/4Fe-4S cluster protein (DUF4445 family)